MRHPTNINVAVASNDTTIDTITTNNTNNTNTRRVNAIIGNITNTDISNVSNGIHNNNVTTKRMVSSANTSANEHHNPAATHNATLQVMTTLQLAR